MIHRAMQMSNVIMVGVATVAAVVALRPRLLRSPLWRATVTPLASIIGSGFLVAGPILAHAAGSYAWLAMSALCLAAYLFGAAIRNNIRYLEPMLQSAPPPVIAILERASDFTLSFAYFISVTYYLSLFASFGLRGFDVIDPTMTRIVSSAVILTLGCFGAIRGLRALENIEEMAVGIKLALIAGLLATLAVINSMAVTQSDFALPQLDHAAGQHEIAILLGLVILVQGFETSRYLGDAYSPSTRIRTMRYAQWLSSAIYVVFILLLTPFFTGALPERGGETSIIDLLAPLGVIIGPLIMITAVASQLSAAVADMNGASGLLAGATRNALSMRAGYVATAAVALAITWSASIYEIITYASKAFVVYYALQCCLAAIVATRSGEGRSFALAALFVTGASLCLAVLIFGIPADA
jgi:hypothetical protein